MSWLDLPRTDEPEEIDDPAQPYADIVRSMGDVARANRLFWGTQTVMSHVARLLRSVPRGTPVRILDIATGSADIPRALLDWGRRRGLDLTVVGVDNHARHAAHGAGDLAVRGARAGRRPAPAVRPALVRHRPVRPGLSPFRLCNVGSACCRRWTC